MASETQCVDYSAVLADLEARKAQIETAISLIKGILTSGLPSPTPLPVPNAAVQPNGGAQTEILSDTFFGLSIPESAKKYLGLRKRPTGTQDIIAALRQGGQSNASGDSFERTVSSVLHRAYKSGAGIVRVSRGTWGLAEWYPNKPKKPQGDD